MALFAGDKLGPYEILAPLGAGGMGEVYNARDTRLNRLVAVKVLPEHIAKREDLCARFEREARTVASLNHPRICVLHDIGEQDSVRYMVMELLEGETLAARIKRGAIPLEQALAYATQIADALDRAHRAGVTHRDIKLQNIMLTRDGVKVLDFGLAKSTHKPGPTEQTLTAALTTEGTVMGTPQYMAPEQFEGKEADARSDIWAFGAVLYEMVTGRKAFQGKSYTSLVGAILSADPAPMSVKPFTPAWLERLVRRCLAKDPEDRWQSMRDVVFELRSPGADTLQPAKLRRWPWIAVAALSAIIAIAVSFLRSREPAPELPVLITSILPPDKAAFNEAVISADGKLLAFTATSEGKRQLWVRPLRAQAAQPLPRTEGAAFPFWSPDNQWIGFFGQGRLEKIRPAGGPAQALCSVDTGYGGSWSQQGVIMYAAAGTGLWRVPEAGGSPARISEGVSFDRWPLFLPGGRRYLYLAVSARGPGVVLGELDPKQTSRLVGDESSPGYAEGSAGEGYLLFVRDGTLMAQPLDPGHGALSGEAFPVVEGIGLAGTSRGAFSFSVSRNGILVYVPGSGRRVQLAWTDRTGTRLEILGEKATRVSGPRLSPDGKKMALVAPGPGPRSDVWDVWIRDLADGGSTRLTFSGGSSPIWSPDGGRIVFSSGRVGSPNLSVKMANGGREEELLLKSPNAKIASDWAGSLLLYTELDPKTKFDLWVLPMEGDRKPSPFLRTEFNEGFGKFSPGGKWIAYASDESGRQEIYVQPYPAPGAKWQVSRDGGRQPLWRRDGKELYWLDGDGTLMAAEVSVGSVFRSGTPQALFETGITSANERFEVSGDGKRFLVPVLTEDPRRAHPLTVVQNWLAAARR